MDISAKSVLPTFSAGFTDITFFLFLVRAAETRRSFWESPLAALGGQQMHRAILFGGVVLLSVSFWLPRLENKIFSASAAAFRSLLAASQPSLNISQFMSLPKSVLRIGDFFIGVINLLACCFEMKSGRYNISQKQCVSHHLEISWRAGSKQPLHSFIFNPSRRHFDKYNTRAVVRQLIAGVFHYVTEAAFAKLL